MFVDWDAGPLATINMIEHDPVRLIGGKPYFSYVRIWGTWTTEDYLLGVVQPLYGDPVFAMRIEPLTPVNCFAQIHIGEAGLAIDGSVTATGADSFFLSWARWSSLSPASFTTVAGTHDTFHCDLTGIYNIGVGPNVLFFEPQKPDQVSLLDTRTSTINLAKLAAESPIGIHTGALALDYTPPYGLALLSESGTMTDVLRPETGRTPTHAAVDRANGDAFVWVESDDAFAFSNPILWTAPFTSDPTLAVKRKVAKLDEGDGHFGGARLAANAGMVLSYYQIKAFRLTRLSDGMGWTIPTEPDEHVVRPLWVDDDEIWFVTAPDTFHGISAATGITRIRRDSLGAPDLPSGL